MRNIKLYYKLYYKNINSVVSGVLILFHKNWYNKGRIADWYPIYNKSTK